MCRVGRNDVRHEVENPAEALQHPATCIQKSRDRISTSRRLCFARHQHSCITFQHSSARCSPWICCVTHFFSLLPPDSTILPDCSVIAAQHCPHLSEMQSTFIALLLALSLAHSASSVPLARPRLLSLRAKSYSIVNVDGGPSTAAPAPTVVETVTAPGVPQTDTVEITTPGPTETATIVQTVQPAPASTAASSASASSASTSATSTSAATSSGVPTSAAPTSAASASATSSPAESTSAAPSLSSETTSSVSYQFASTPAPSVSAPSPTTAQSVTIEPTIVTVVTAAQPSTTEYYDDGMWHTSYVIKSTTLIAETMTTSSEPITTATKRAVDQFTSALPSSASASAQTLNQTATARWVR